MDPGANWPTRLASTGQLQVQQETAAIQRVITEDPPGQLLASTNTCIVTHTCTHTRSNTHTQTCQKQSDVDLESLIREG